MPLVNMHFSTPVAVGAKVTVEEIKRENVNLQLCQQCADLIERSKKPQYSVESTKVFTTSGRINRVLKFMENYIKRGILYIELIGLNMI